MACLLVGGLLVAPLTLAEDYDFRTSAAYGALSAGDRGRLEQVHRDLMLLWGALDRYVDHHDGTLPEGLELLVPRFLGELPTDPFATAETARAPAGTRYRTSRDGWSYRYRKGSPGNRAWVLASVGLPDFPYLAEHGNVGLYVCKGTWISGFNPAVLRGE